MTTAARDVNKALESRQFANVTQALYRYWLYELCDVYIENSKSIIKDGTPDERRSAIDTLYTVLDAALRMTHPVMPFLTEELWQRLPRRPKDETKSIVIAEFPEYDASLDDPESERAYELILGCSKGIRSLLTEYSIKENGTAFVQPLNDEAHATGTAESAAIKTLSGKNLTSLSVLDTNANPDVPCAVYAVNASAAVFVQLPGKVDAGKEISRLKPKLENTAKAVSEQEKTIAALEGKVEGEVRKTEEGKLKDLLSEQGVLQRSLEMFETLKL
jgi:valyl-tRNA synthetase